MQKYIDNLYRQLYSILIKIDYTIDYNEFKKDIINITWYSSFLNDDKHTIILEQYNDILLNDKIFNIVYDIYKIDEEYSILHYTPIAFFNDKINEYETYILYHLRKNKLNKLLK